MVSESAQDYLKAIWKLEQAGEMSTTALAEALHVSPASATAMLKKLATLGLVVHERYHGASSDCGGLRTRARLRWADRAVGASVAGGSDAQASGPTPTTTA